MKRTGSILLLAATLGFPLLGDTTPLLVVESGNDSQDVSLALQPGGLWGISAPVTLTFGSSSLTLDSVSLDIDPSVHYAFSVSNEDTSPGFTPYSMTFTTPTTLAAGTYAVSSSLGVTLTDGDEDGATLMATPSGPVQQSFIGGADANVDLLKMQDVETTPGGTQTFPTLSASNTYSLGSTASNISVTTSFNLSNDDDAGLTGRFDVNAVPEPPSVLLGLVCAAALVGLVARRRLGMA